MLVIVEFPAATSTGKAKAGRERATESTLNDEGLMTND
jgi:hypothetical protein